MHNGQLITGQAAALAQRLPTRKVCMRRHSHLVYTTKFQQHTSKLPSLLTPRLCAGRRRHNALLILFAVVGYNVPGGSRSWQTASGTSKTPRLTVHNDTPPGAAKYARLPINAHVLAHVLFDTVLR